MKLCCMEVKMRWNISRLLGQVLLLLIAQLLVSKSYAVELVDVELQLLLDISGSVDSSEYQLQLQGYQAAFQNDDVQDAILLGDIGKVAVQLIMWSGPNQQKVMLDWQLIDSVESADSFADTVAALARPFSGWTAPGSAIDYAYQDILTNDYDGLRKIIDVSGDGIINSGADAKAMGEEALAAGVDTINGIVISQSEQVIDYYVDNVAAGDNAFVIVAQDYNDFEQAIAKKLAGEISGSIPKEAIAIVQVPEPSSVILFGCGALCLFLRKKS